MEIVKSWKINWIDLIIVLTAFGVGFLPSEIVLCIELILICLKMKGTVSKKFLFIYLIIAIHGGIGVLIRTNDLSMYLKQLIGIGISYVFYNTYIGEWNIKNVIKLIKYISLFVCCVCILQYLASFIGLSWIYDLRWLIPNQRNIDFMLERSYRSYGFYLEPAQCSLAILPASSAGLYRLFGRYKEELSGHLNVLEATILVLGLITTFSITGLFGLIIMIGMIFVEYGFSIKRTVAVFVVMSGILILCLCNHELQVRITETASIVFDRETSYSEYNLSTQAIYLNAIAAFKGFASTFGFGGGIGSHLMTYEKFVPYIPNSGYGLNNKDANSLLLRLISEMGILGIAFLGWFLTRYRNKNHDLYSIINLCCIAYFAARLLRQGHWFNDGLFLIVILYVKTKSIEEDNSIEIGKKQISIEENSF